MNHKAERYRNNEVKCNRKTKLLLFLAAQRSKDLSERTQHFPINS